LILISNSFATTEGKVSGKELIELTRQINLSKKTFKDALASISKLDSKKAEEMDSFLKSNPEILNIVLPEVNVDNDSLYILAEGKKITVELYYNGQMILTIDKKRIRPDFSLPFDQMAEKIKTDLKGKKHFSLLSLLINDANAMVGVMILTVLVALPVLYVGLIMMVKLAAKKLVVEADNICNEIKYDTSLGQKNSGDLKDIYNKISEIYVKHCLVSKDFIDQTCQGIPAIKKCIKDTVERIDLKFVNDSSMKNSKQPVFDSAADKFVGAGASK
jgi:hypothetical protein